MRASDERRRIDALVVGGSAGVVEALTSVLPTLKPDCGVPVLIVMHLPRERESLLVDIFESKCRLRVTEAQDKEPIERGTIYFAPPDYHLLVDQGPSLALSADDLVHFSRPSIDVLFESAADTYGDRLLGVVLSGANSDGAAGLQAIARAGGLTLVQNPDSAVARSMPEAALRAAPGSSALTLRQLADVFKEISGGQLRRTEGWTQA